MNSKNKLLWERYLRLSKTFLNCGPTTVSRPEGQTFALDLSPVWPPLVSVALSDDYQLFTLSTGTSFTIITEADAKAIALRHAGLTESEVRFTKVELDYDDGAYEYDIEFVAGNTEYDYTVNAANGKIVDFDREPVEHHFSLSVLVRWIKDFFAAIFG